MTIGGRNVGRKGSSPKEFFRSPILEQLEPRLLLSGNVIISEFVTDNADTLTDGFGKSPDWIELQNTSTSPVDLTGWKLEDGGATWTFPAVTLPAQGYLVVFASDKDVQDPLGYWHTNFKLTPDGEYLALLDDTGAVVHEYAPEYPEQLEDISYGVLYDEEGQDVLVDKGDAAKYLVRDTGPLDPTWIQPGFNDAAWDTGTTGLGFGLSVPDGNVTLIDKGSSWRYLDDGSDQGTAWRGTDFDDGEWAFGPAQLGYGDGDEATVVSYGSNPSNKHITTYFRHEFDVSNVWAFTDLTINVQRDDGAVIYLNGQEIARSNMPAGGINYQTRTGVVGGGAESMFYEYHKNPTGILVEGENVLAVEIHQTAPTSSDISFNLELIGDTSTSDLIETDLQADMLGVNASVLVRVPFTVVDPLDYADLTLDMAYEDGYVAYLNGTRVAVRNAPGMPDWNSTALSDRSVPDAVQFAGVDLTDYLDLLVAGDNVLAIHAMNDTASDSTFLICPKLTALAGVMITENYFTTPTPRAANIPGVLGMVADTRFSVDRGFFDEAFNVAITTDTPGAEIRYTLDASEPTATTGTVYTSPIHIDGTTALRAAAYRPGYLPTDVDTHTYIFLDDVLQQSATPEGFPESWNGTLGNYAMDPNVVNHPTYGATIRDDMRAVPTLSLVTSVENMFGATGIYANTGSRGPAWEKPASIEWINPDGSTLFQVNGGVQLVGGASRGAGCKKHSLRLVFKGMYGPRTLNYPVFGDDAAEKINTITLRAGFNDRISSLLVRDRWAAERQLAAGSLGGHGTFVHLYIDGLYWGLYNPVERPDEAFAASYLGGEKEDYDAYNIEGLKAGNSAGWNQLMGLLGDPVTNYSAIEQMLDIPDFADYFIVNQFGSNWDWPQNNWWASYNREGGGKWRFHSWDAEGCLNNGNRVDQHGSSLGYIYWQLRQVEEFRQVFGDRAHRHLFNDGALTPEANIAWLDEVAGGIYEAVVGESARWGNGYGDNEGLQLRSHWASRINSLRTNYFPQRTQTYLNQIKAVGLYPNVVAPSFNINGSYQHGGMIDLTDSLTIDAPAGTIYYTLDGSDPSSGGTVYSGAVALSQGGHVKSRVYDGGVWSALNEATYYIDVSTDIRVTEVMYSPAEPTATEFAAGFENANDFEFIEITNISDRTLPLTGLRFDNGIDFTFGEVSIAPDEYVVVVSNRAAFEFRYSGYGGQIAGEYGTGLIIGTLLANAGEKVELDAPIAGSIQEFSYEDGWYDHTDGDGFSLTIRNPEGALDLWGEEDGWRASAAPGGSPGSEDTLVTPGSIIIHEVLAHTDAPLVDTIELRNESGAPVDVSGWWLSDRKTDEFGVEVLTKYQIPTLPAIAAGGYLVLNENDHFGTGFLLSELGDNVYLSSDASGVAGGYREHVDFGGSPNGVSIGLHTKSTGGTDFTLLGTPFFGLGNSAPYFEDLVINEIMYNPPDPTPEEIAAGFINNDDFEFIEIYNKSDTVTHTLSNFYIGGGVGLTFGWCDADGTGAESWTLETGATATWTTTTLPAGLDSYEVLARWDLLDGEGDERDLDGQAKYTIAHSGLEPTDVLRDQKPEEYDEGPDYMDEFGWVSLGTYDFDGSGQVVLTRGTNDPGNWTIADQVKFVSTTYTELVDNPTLGSWNTTNGPATLGPGEYAVIVSNRDAFNYRYNLPTIVGQQPSATIAGQYTGNLSNDGEKVKLMRAGDPEPGPSYFIPYYRIDYVNYNDKSPWPAEPDGQGPSLSRIDPYGPSIPFPYGNDPISWFAGAMNGSPGEANSPADMTSPTIPRNVAAQVNAPYAQIELTWSASEDLDTYVDHYIIYRDGGRIGTSELPAYTDTGVAPFIQYSYEVSAANRDGIESAHSAAVEIAVPGLVSYTIPADTRIALVFNEALVETSAEALANYTFVGGTLQNASLGPDGVTVTLTTAPMTVGQGYTLTAGSLSTVSGALMPPGQRVSFRYGQAIESTTPTVATPIVDVTVDEDDAVGTVLNLDPVFNDPDVGDTLTFSVTNNTNTDVVRTSIAAGELRLSYVADRNGTADITVRATDLAGAWVENTFTVTVNSISDDPVVAAPIGDVDVDEDAADTVLDLVGVFYDPDIFYYDPNIVDDDDILTLSVTGNTNPGLVTPGIDGNELTLSCVADQNGEAVITVRATDSDANWVEDTFTVSIDPINDVPVVDGAVADFVVNENAADTVLVLSDVFDDVDILTNGDSLTFTVEGNTNPGLVDTSVSGTLSYTPDQYGAAEITVRATDSVGAWVEDTFTVGVASDGPATVEQVLAGASSWSAAFYDYLDAQGLGHPTLSHLGYRIPDGVEQLDTLPWNNLDTLVISFSKDVSVVEGDLVLYDVNAAPYAIDSFVYTPSTFTATWTLAVPIGADKLLIDLSDSVYSGGVALDGEWTDETSTFPSGDGAAGGDFQFRFNVLPGDTDRSGLTELADGGGIRDRLFVRAGAPSYSAVHDLNGSGGIDFVDWLIVRANQGTSLPPGAPVAPVGAPGAPIAPIVPIAPSAPIAALAPAPVAALQAVVEPITTAAAPVVVPIVSQLLDDSDASDDSIAAAASAPAVDLLVESPPAVDYISGRQPISVGSPETAPYRAATAEYDLRPLGDDPPTGETDDLLADILAESSLAVRL